MASSCAISIIIPTYNVESYIARCLESCINQSLREIEILVIDDCGSDGSIQIAQDYAKLDSRIKIIHNENNLGTFATRIVGIRQALGEYVLFVDADDYLHLQACELLYKHSTKYSASILHFKASYKANPHTPLLARLTHYTRYILPTRFCKRPLYNEQIAYNFFLDSRQFPKFTLWDKCYDTALLRQACKHFTNSCFTPIVADDLLFFLVIASLATNYISIDKRLYFYCLNTHSSMQAPSKRARRIESFAYVTNALHTLELDSSLLPLIARAMSKDLAALIILESRVLDSRTFDTSLQETKIARRGGGTRIYTSSAHTTCRSWAYPSTQDSKIYALYQITLSTLLRPVSAVLGTLPYLYSYVCLYYFFRVYQSLESTFSKKNSASGEQCGSIARYGKGTNGKFANLYHNAQSSHSPTAKPAIAVQGVTEAGFFRNLRILEEKQAQSKNTLSSRAVCQHGVAIHINNAQKAQSIASLEKVDSTFETMDCHADKSARNDGKNATSKKVDSRNEAQNLNKSAKDSRICENATTPTTPQAEAELDSSVDCHALQSKARNDDKAQNLNESIKDSRILDEKCGLQGKSQGSYLDGNDRRDFSPLPHFSLKAKSTSQAESPLSLKADYAA